MAGAIQTFRSDESRKASEALRTAQQTLGQDQFMTLLLTELRYQDALDPMKDKDFIAQLAQFSSLAEMNALSKAFDRFVTASSMMQMLGILGRSVEGVGKDGPVAGRAVGLKTVGGVPLVTVLAEDGTSATLAVSEITSIEV
jgi:flagellar basal-body rod modification protein FlgD